MVDGGRRSFFSRRIVRDRLLLVLLGALVFCVPLAATSLWDRHEARFVLTGREMLESGDWVVPRNQGEPVHFYPPLMGWLVAVSFAVFGGLSEFAARFPSALAGVGCLLLTYEITRLLFDRRTALTAALILMSTMAWNKFVGICQADIPMVFFFLASLWAFLKFRSEQPRRWRWLFLLYGSAGVGALAKGPQGPVMTVLVLSAFLAWERDGRGALELKPLLGALIGFVPVIPWFVLVHHRAGTPFLAALWHETFDMAAGGKMLMHAESNPLFYIGILAAGALPWTMFFIGAFLAPRSAFTPVERPSWRFVLAWLLSLLIMFSASKAKRNYYMLPIYPTLAIIAATWWTRRLRRIGPKWEWAREKGPIVVFWTAGVIALAAFPFLPEKDAIRFENARFVVAGAIGFGSVIGLLVSWLLLKGRKPVAFGVLVTLVNVAILTHLTLGIQSTDEDGRRGKVFLKAADAKVGKDALMLWGVENHEAAYVGAPHTFANALEQVSGAKTKSWLIVPERKYRETPALQESWDLVMTSDLAEDNLALLHIKPNPGGKR